MFLQTRLCAALVFLVKLGASWSRPGFPRRADPVCLGLCHPVTMPDTGNNALTVTAGSGAEHRNVRCCVPVIALTGDWAGLQLARRHNNFLPLFKSPVPSPCPTFWRQHPRGESGWVGRAPGPRVPSQLGSCVASRAHGGKGGQHCSPGAWLLHAAGTAFPGSAPSHSCLLTRGPQCWQGWG